MLLWAHSYWAGADLGTEAPQRKCTGRRRRRNLGQDSAINGKSTAECKASEREGGGRHSRILGLPLRDSLYVSSSFPCSVILLICTDSLFYGPGPGFCNTRHKWPLNSLEGTAIIRRRNCSHQMEKIKHFQSAIFLLVKSHATWSFELQLLQCYVQEREIFLESTFKIKKLGTISMKWGMNLAHFASCSNYQLQWNILRWSISGSILFLDLVPINSLYQFTASKWNALSIRPWVAWSLSLGILGQLSFIATAVLFCQS